MAAGTPAHSIHLVVCSTTLRHRSESDDDALGRAEAGSGDRGDSDESIVLLSFAARHDELLVTEIVHTASRLPITVIYRYASDALR